MAANILNNTGVALWLKSPDGAVAAIAIGGAAPLLVNGNYQISDAEMAPGLPLAPAPNILITNVGGMAFNFAAQGGLLSPFNLIPRSGPFVLGVFGYKVTPYSPTPRSTIATITNNSTITLWLRYPTGYVNSIPNNGVAALSGNGNYQISDAETLAPGPPLSPAPNIILTNVGSTGFYFTASPPGDIPGFVIHAGHKADLLNIGYNVQWAGEA